MTYAELKAELDKLTPEQLAMEVQWSGDMRGGAVTSLWIAEEDHINPSGDGAEPISLYVQERAVEDEVSLEVAELRVRNEEEIVVAQGQPQLVVD